MTAGLFAAVGALGMGISPLLGESETPIPPEIRVLDATINELKEDENLLLKQYEDSIERLRTNYTKDGNLQGVLATDAELIWLKEIKENEGAVAPSATDDGIAKLRKVLDSRLPGLARERAEKTRTFVQATLQELELRVKELVKSGEIDAASSLSKAASELRTRYGKRGPMSLTTENFAEEDGEFSHGTDWHKKWLKENRHDPERIKVDKRLYAEKDILFAHAPSEFLYKFDRPVYALTFEVYAISDSMTFEVLADGESIYLEEEPKHKQIYRKKLSLKKGATELLFRTDDQDNYVGDFGMWLNPVVDFGDE